MQGRGRFFLILGVVLLGLAILGAVFIVVLQRRGPATPEAPSAETPEPGATEVVPETRDVVVAMQNIGEGERIRREAVGLIPKETAKLPKQVFYNVDDVVGQLARQDIDQRDVLVADMVIAVEDVQRLGWRASPLIPEDRVAVAFPVSQLSSVNYAVHPGDRVDVIACGAFIDVDVDTQIKAPVIYTGDESCQAGCQPVGEQVQRIFCQLMVQDAGVLGVGLWGQPQEAAAEEEAAEGAAEGTEGGDGQLPTSFDTIILMVSPQDSVVLMYLLRNDFVIDMALRAVEGMDAHETEQVTLEYLMTRFRISAPTKLPYRLEVMQPEGAIPLPEPSTGQ